MKYFLIIVILFSFLRLKSQELFQLSPWATDSTYVLGALSSGEPTWVLKSSITTGFVPTSRTISTTSPLQGGGDLSTNRTFSILQSNTSQNGYLSSTDWNTFNTKIGSLNGLTAATQTFATSTTGSDFTISSASTTHTFGLPFTGNTLGLRLGYNSVRRDNSVAIGINCMGSSGSSAANNVAIGNDVLRIAGSTGSGGTNNVGVGFQSLYALTTGINNFGLGTYALGNVTTGNYNIAIGTLAGLTLSTQSNNTMIGYEAGRTNTGSDNVFIGYQAGRNETGSNYLYIENSTGTPLIGGNFSTNKVGINTAIASIVRDLNVTGEARITDLTTDTPTRIVGADADGDLGAVTIGTGLSFSSGTINNSSPDQTVSLTGGGITGISGTYPNFTITSTEVDGSTTNELQTISTNSAAGNITLSNGGGTLNLNVNDADADPTNEHNTAVTSGGLFGTGNTLVITDGGGSKTGIIPQMTGATAGTAGVQGVVPPSSAGDQNKYLRADATWQTISTGVTGSGTSGYVTRWNGTSTITDAAGVYSNTNGLGFGTTNPLFSLHLNNKSIYLQGNSTIIDKNNSGGTAGYFLMGTGGFGVDWEFLAFSKSGTNNTTLNLTGGSSLAQSLVPTGGTTGQILTNTGSGNYAWQNTKKEWAALSNENTSMTLSTTYTKMPIVGLGAEVGDGVNIQADEANDEIDIITTGEYTLELKANCKSNTASHVVYWDIMTSTPTSQSCETKHYYSSTSEYSHNNMSWRKSITGGTSLGLYVKTSSGTPNVNDCQCRIVITKL